MISYDRMRDDLYELEIDRDGSVPDRHAIKACASSLAKQQLTQWHKRLGHPSFMGLESYLCFLEKKCDLETLCCACELAKAHTCFLPF